MAQQNDEECQLILVQDVMDTTRSAQVLIDTAHGNGFGLIAYPLINTKLDNQSLITQPKDPNNILSDIPFNYNSDSDASIFQSVYGKISRWLSFKPGNNSEQCLLNAHSELLLQRQIEWASHLGIFSVILPPVIHEDELKENESDNNNITDIAMNYASAIYAAFVTRGHMLGLIPISFTAQGWKIWQILSILLRNIKHVRPALIIEKDIPSKELMQQWFAEGVQIFFLSQDTFITNKKGYPVLSKAHQRVFKHYLRWTDCTIICNAESKRYTQYFRHLRSTCDELTENECDEKPFWDVLQTPLQPLSRNLEYATYETFEADPVKYVQYEKAMIQAFIDMDKDKKIKVKLPSAKPFNLLTY